MKIKEIIKRKSPSPRTIKACKLLKDLEYFDSKRGELSKREKFQQRSLENELMNMKVLDSDGNLIYSLANENIAEWMEGGDIGVDDFIN